MSRVYDREDAASWPDMGERHCIVCGRPAPNRHHMPPKGMGGGKAWEGCLLALCGSGTTGCHGLWHHGDLELRFMDGRWMWRGKSSGITARKWTPCNDDDFWEELDWLLTQV